jgi:hypothetical protein
VLKKRPAFARIKSTVTIPRHTQEGGIGILLRVQVVVRSKGESKTAPVRLQPPLPRGRMSITAWRELSFLISIEPTRPTARNPLCGEGRKGAQDGTVTVTVTVTLISRIEIRIRIKSPCDTSPRFVPWIIDCGLDCRGSLTVDIRRSNVQSEGPPIG